MGKTNKKMGHPVQYDDKFYMMILKAHETLSISELMRYHHKSASTICRWIARGREIADEQEKS